MTWFTRTHRRVCFRFRTTVVAAALSCAMLAAASPAVAQDEWRRVELSGGGLLATFDTTVRLDDPLGLDGTSIDFEDDLGLDSGTGTWFVQGLWRISRRNQLAVSYQNFSREVSRTVLDRDIVFGDETFTVGAEVSAFIDARYLTVDYGFAFVATPTVEFGASVGINAVRLETGLDLSASVAGGSSVSREIARQVSYDVPLPLPGLFLNARPHSRVTLHATTKGLTGSIDEYSALLLEAKAGVDVTIARPLAIGAAYYFNRARLTRNDTRTDGQIVYQFHGPVVHAVLAW